MLTPVKISHSHQSRLKGLEDGSDDTTAQTVMHILSLLVVEHREEIDGRKRKEEKHRVEEDEAGDDHPRHVCAQGQRSIDKSSAALYAPQSVIKATRCLVQ